MTATHVVHVKTLRDVQYPSQTESGDNALSCRVQHRGLRLPKHVVHNDDLTVASCKGDIALSRDGDVALRGLDVQLGCLRTLRRAVVLAEEVESRVRVVVAKLGGIDGAVGGVAGAVGDVRCGQKVAGNAEEEACGRV